MTGYRILKIYIYPKKNRLRSVYFIILFLIIIFIGCEKAPERNRVELEQIEIDGSNNDRHIFRNEIKREKWLKNRYKKDEF